MLSSPRTRRLLYSAVLQGGDTRDSRSERWQDGHGLKNIWVIAKGHEPLHKHLTA